MAKCLSDLAHKTAIPIIFSELRFGFLLNLHHTAHPHNLHLENDLADQRRGQISRSDFYRILRADEQYAREDKRAVHDMQDRPSRRAPGGKHKQRRLALTVKRSRRLSGRQLELLAEPPRP